MSVLYIVVPLALVIVAVFVAFFVWSVRSGQMDDLDSPATRVMLDDDGTPITRPADRAAKADAARR